MSLRPADRGLVSDLGRIVTPGRVLHRAIDRLGRSGDASITMPVPSRRQTRPCYHSRACS